MKKKFNINRRKFISTGAVFTLGTPLIGKAEATHPPTRNLQPDVQPEWRNKQPGMAYRQLGNTGLMISEIVNGGNPVRLDNLRTTEIAIERGVNYLDMAPAYGRGECEESGMGIIAMKAAMALATQHEALKPIPEWRIQKVERIVPGNMDPPVKAYLWALQNKNISAVISNL